MEGAASILKVRESVGRPPLESDQPELLKAIVDIAIYGSATHDRRRTEEIRSCRTLDDLTEKLVQIGFKIQVPPTCV